MKIGVVTIFKGANFGAYLQAYALKKYLEEKGENKVYHISVNDDKSIHHLFYRYICKRWLKGIKYTINYIKFGRKKLQNFKLGWQEFNEGSKTENYDAVILGSDEVFNTANPIFSDPLYYGVGINGKVKLSYAASMGPYNGDNPPEYVGSAIKAMTGLLVRDEKTKKYAEKYADREVKIVCDPTLLYDFENKELPVCNDEYINNNKYILVYAYRYSQNEKLWINSYAQENNLKIVSAGFYEPWCDYCLNCTPLEFVDVIKKAEAVYTSSFHCGIFSLYNCKKMVVRASGQKVTDLFKRLGADNLIIYDNEDYKKFNGIMNSGADFDKIMSNIVNFRQCSAKELDEVLKVVE